MGAAAPNHQTIAFSCFLLKVLQKGRRFPRNPRNMNFSVFWKCIIFIRNNFWNFLKYFFLEFGGCRHLPGLILPERSTTYPFNPIEKFSGYWSHISSLTDMNLFPFQNGKINTKITLTFWWDKRISHEMSQINLKIYREVKMA